MSIADDGHGRDRVVVVLLDSYDQLEPLDSLRANVKTVTDAWHRAGFTSCKPEFLGNGTLQEIQTWVSKWDPPQARQLLIYWTGHGKQLDDRTFVLLARDTDRDFIDATNTFSVEHLGAVLSRCEVDEIVVFVDACHSGGGHREIIDAFIRGSRRRVRRVGKARPAIAAIASADYDQYAGENVFSVALARVLEQGPPKGYWGDQQRDFTVAELVAALRAVIVECEVDQQPQFAVDGVSAHHSGDLRIRNPRYREFAPDLDGEIVGSPMPVSGADLDEHFWVKFRGIDSADQRGFYFTGRAQVLREINGWLTDGAGMLVITGRPGVGKSAILGRTVIMATPALRQRLPDYGVDVSRMDPDDQPPDHAIDVAVHARNKDLSNCMTDIGAALRMPAPDGGWRSADDFVDVVGNLGRPLTILIDALDEARPIDAMRIARELLTPLAAIPRVRVLVGTRADASDPLGAPSDEPTAHNTILRALGSAQVINVDRYNATGDIYAYCTARLQNFPASIYATDDPRTLRRVASLASAVTERCRGSFLLARIATRALATHDQQLDEDAPDFDILVRADVEDAIGADLARYGYRKEQVGDLLTALAMTEGAGLPRRNVWLTVGNAIRQRTAAYEDTDLVWVLNHAGTYITQSGEHGETVYRLYHQTLTEYFRDQTNPVQANLRIAKALIDQVPGPPSGRHWDLADPYTQVHLATHAVNGGVLLDILDDRIFRYVAAGRMAAALLRTADAAPDEATLDRAIAFLRTAVATTAGSDLHQDSYQRSLLAALQFREQRSQSLMDADEAIVLNEDLLRRTTEGSPDYPALQANLGSALRLRYTRTGNLDDLARAINALKRSVDLSPITDPTRYDHLYQLGLALADLVDRTGDMASLDQAIVCLREAADGIGASHPRRHTFLTALSATLRLRLDWIGQLSDLDEAIALSAQAAELAGPENPQTARHLSNLASALIRRYAERGNQDDLEQAVANARAAIRAADPRDPQLGELHGNLSFVLRARYLDSEDPADLKNAVLSARRAVNATRTDAPEHPRRLSALGTILVTSYEATREPGELNEAISACNNALSEFPPTHVDRSDALVTVGLALYHQFSGTGEVTDLNSSIELLTEAVALTPAGHRGLPQRLLALATSLHARFDSTNNYLDLDQSIAALQRATEVASAESPEQATYLYNLGRNLRVRGELTGRRSDLDSAEACLDRASALATAPVSVRIRAARDRGALAAAAGHFARATDSYATAVRLLPRLAGNGMNRTMVVNRLTEWSGLAPEAAACAINAGAIELAVQLLEQGRGVLWTQVLNSRDDLSQLSDVAPALATRLAAVRDELARHSRATSVATDPTVLEHTTSADVDRRRRLAREWDDLVAQVRTLRGFEDFLAAPRIESLLAAATDGPIVIVNVSRFRCDALILRPTGIEVVALPTLHADDAQRWLTVLLDAVVNPYRSSLLSDLLAWLWDSTVRPVLQALGLTGPPRDGAWPRMWWCPTGPLTLMPLHAAGQVNGIDDHDAAESALDRVLSSYVPTVTTFRHVQLRRVPLSDSADVLAVGMPNTEAYGPLPHAAREIELVRQAKPGHTVVLLNHDATVRTVIDNMHRCRWVHFACHSRQDINDPGRSALLLHDGPLTVFDMAGLQVENAELMYLASCQTAMGGTQIPDESVHMAAAVQLAGYRHVISALWPIIDRTASQVADRVYNRLSVGGELSADQAAHALHETVRELRARHPQHPYLWAPFIHSGP
ncbi:CHAT domain-containing protein [Lentzea sp. HUAS TT2]|uniref:CHAT domain-containing protein n=1 Tax=Lentzea sp. HUAS TT2 TaxID=3447454 RepID=UPI003F705A5D